MKISEVLFEISACLTSTAMSFNLNLIRNFTVVLLKSQQTVVIGCNIGELINIGSALLSINHMLYLLDMDSNNFSLASILVRENHAKTLVILDCRCSQTNEMIAFSSEKGYFNKTYQWLLWDIKDSVGVESILGNVKIGPNAQITYINQSSLPNFTQHYFLFDVYSMGRHLNAPIKITMFAEWIETGFSQNFIIYKEILHLQGIASRWQFDSLTLRGGTVIDLDNITTNKQIETLLSSQNYNKDNKGISGIVKYHFALLELIREQLNFTVNFRNARGWGGRLGNTTFRLGLLGIIKRNEVDVASTGSFNRLNRFAEFDIIHQSYKFEAGFIYKYTPDLGNHNANGNFLAPFVQQVWIISILTLVSINIIWMLVELFKKQLMERQNSGNYDGVTIMETLMRSLAAVCQQGLDPTPISLPSRTVALTMFLFSMIMYNYYTSSVVGGLLSTRGAGPETITEILNSPLKLSFEDIGYHKVLLQDRHNQVVQRMYKVKILPKRGRNDLPVFTNIQKALPIVKQGGYALHCELISAYPIVSRLFNANEVCDLRVVTGLLETEIINWIVPKNSHYTEIFRTLMCKARQGGLVHRTLKNYQPKKPQCQALYTVYPVNLAGVEVAFSLLLGGLIISLFTLFLECQLSRCSPQRCGSRF